MKHLQKAKKVFVKIFYKKNGHFITIKEFACALDAKHYVEGFASSCDRELEVFITDEYNELYHGNGLKIA